MHVEPLNPCVFPLSMGLTINMLPMVIGDPASLPRVYRHYLPLVTACEVEREQLGRIGYLSIWETQVPHGGTQRRPGIHTEGWGEVGGPAWGSGGRQDGRRHGGLYLATSRADTCRIWDLRIEHPGPHGDCESSRATLETMPFLLMEAHRLYWIHDRTPHEALAQPEAGVRQWFRFVTSGVTHWFARYSTPNPLGIKPAAHIVHARVSVKDAWRRQATT